MQRISPAAPVLNTSYGYTGREKDSESGLMYYRARYYDPNVGRFLQRDPEPGQLTLPVSVINAYTYVGNNPLNLSDPSGRDFWGAFGSILAGIAIAVGTIAAIVFTAGAAAPAIAAAVGGGIGGAIAAGAVGAGIGAGIGAAGGALAGGFIGGGVSVAQGGAWGAGFVAGAGTGAIVGAIVGAVVGFGVGYGVGSSAAAPGTDTISVSQAQAVGQSTAVIGKGCVAKLAAFSGVAAIGSFSLLVPDPGISKLISGTIIAVGLIGFYSTAVSCF